jgi:hypothetical protein
MTVFVQKFKDGRTNKYEVFRRSTAPEDSTLAVEETRQAAIATAGQLANPSEAIRESADQNDFGIIRDGDVAPGPGDNPSLDPAGGFFESSSDFTPALNENQAPLGSVDDSLDGLLGAPSNQGGQEPSLNETLDSLFGGGGGDDDDDSAEVVTEQDTQPSVIDRTQGAFDKAFGPADSDEGGVVQDAINNPRSAAEKAADAFFVNRDVESSSESSSSQSDKIASRDELPKIDQETAREVNQFRKEVEEQQPLGPIK